MGKGRIKRNSVQLSVLLFGLIILVSYQNCGRLEPIASINVAGSGIDDENTNPPEDGGGNDDGGGIIIDDQPAPLPPVDACVPYTEDGLNLVPEAPVLNWVRYESNSSNPKVTVDIDSKTGSNFNNKVYFYSGMGDASDTAGTHMSLLPVLNQKIDHITGESADRIRFMASAGRVIRRNGETQAIELQTSNPAEDCQAMGTGGVNLNCNNNGMITIANGNDSECRSGEFEVVVRSELGACANIKSNERRFQVQVINSCLKSKDLDGKDPLNYDELGEAVSIDGDLMAALAGKANVGPSSNNGYIQIYRLNKGANLASNSDDTWDQSQRVDLSSFRGGTFPTSLKLVRNSQNKIFVYAGSAIANDYNGALWRYELNADGTFKSANPTQFLGNNTYKVGASIDYASGYVVSGIDEDNDGFGSLTILNESLSPLFKISDPESGIYQAKFGYSVSMSKIGADLYVAAGRPFNRTSNQKGKVHLFKLNSTMNGATKVKTFEGDYVKPNDEFGFSVDLSNDGKLAIGAPNYKAADVSGRVIVFDITDSIYRAVLNGTSGFGYSLSMDENSNLFISSPFMAEVGGKVDWYRFKDPIMNESAGKNQFVLKKNRVIHINEGIRKSGSQFGYSLDASGSNVVVGSPKFNIDVSKQNRGKVSVFDYVQFEGPGQW
ncbi:MAG: integrin alpha [Bdellovibrionales bacterium]